MILFLKLNGRGHNLTCSGIFLGICYDIQTVKENYYSGN